MLTNQSRNSNIDRMMTLNRVLDEALNEAWSGQQSATRVWVPAIDVVERKDAYLVYVELPGVKPSEVDLSFEQNILSIRGTKPASVDVGDGSQSEVRVYAAERVSGAFERSIRMPEFVDGEQIGAEYGDGLLTVTIPKAQAARPRKIQIGGRSVQSNGQKSING